MNKTRDIFVFSGQSNMMGAASLPPKHKLCIKNSLEFKYKNIYLNRGDALFQKVSYDCGEFLYLEPENAYPNNEEKSPLANYAQNACFIPSMASEGKAFNTFSECNYTQGACMIPYFCENYENLGESPIVTHIAKGSVQITHYFTKDMTNEYNSLKPLTSDSLSISQMQEYSAEIFSDKIKAFFKGAENNFDNLGKKVFVWMQGESNSGDSFDEHRLKLEILYKKIKSLGFDYFFCIRVGYWNNPDIINVINAQEDFCMSHQDCFMVSRAISYMPDTFFKTPENWLKRIDDKYLNCRDTYYGYDNPHINEKGFMIIGEELAKNTYRILKEQKEPLLGEELLNGVCI